MTIPSRIIGGGEDVQNYQDRFFQNREKQVKKYHSGDINQKFIREIKKMDTLYNPDSFNYKKYKFKNITLKDNSQ